MICTAPERCCSARRASADAVLLAGEVQQVAAAPALISPPSAYQGMALGGEGNVLGAAAAVQVAGAAPLRDRIVMAAVGGQAEQAGHQALPFTAMRADTLAIQGMGDQVRGLVRYRLQQEIITMVAVHLAIEAQQVAIQVGYARLLAAQVKGNLGTLEGSAEMLFGVLIAVFQAMQYLIHAAL